MKNLWKAQIRKPLMKSDAVFKTVLLQKGKYDFSWGSEDWIQRNSLRKDIATLPAKLYCFKLQFKFLLVRWGRLFIKLVHVATAFPIHFSVDSPAQLESNTGPCMSGLCGDSYQIYF